ncbi:MAG: RnfABCDGE type electron transport complex subunit D [Bacilli bacterium]
MKFVANSAPNLRSKRSTTQIMLLLSAGLGLLWVAAIIFNFTSVNAKEGINSILVMLVSLLATTVADVGMISIGYKKHHGKYGDYLVNNWLKSYSYVTAIIFALTLPSWTPLYVVAVGAIFATVIGKYVFGGFGHNIFNPAAVGRIFVSLSFGAKLAAPAGITATTGLTVTSIYAMQAPKWGLADLSITGISLTDSWLGLYPGALGETFTLLILIIGIALAVLKVINWRTPVFYLGTVAVTAFFIALFTKQNILDYILIHLSLGGLMFGAVFMLTDPVTGPTSPYGKALAGVIAGLITMLIRIQGSYPEGVAFAILLTNMVSPMIDHFATGRTNRNLEKKWAWVGGLLVTSIALNSGLAVSKYKTYAAEQTNIQNTLNALGLEELGEYAMGKPVAFATDSAEAEAGLVSSTTLTVDRAGEETIYGIVYDGFVTLGAGEVDFKVGLVDKHFVGFVLENAKKLTTEIQQHVAGLEEVIQPALELEVTSTLEEVKATLATPAGAEPLASALVAAGTHFATLVPQIEPFKVFTGSHTSEYSPEHAAGETNTTTVTVAVNQFFNLLDLSVSEPTSGGNFAKNWEDNWPTIKSFYLSKNVAEIKELTVADLVGTDGAVANLTITCDRVLLALHDAFKDVTVYRGEATSPFATGEYGGDTTTKVIVYVDATDETITAIDVLDATSGGNFEKKYQANLEAILSVYLGKTVAEVSAYTAVPAEGAVVDLTFTIDRILAAILNAFGVGE